jgi:hypothetical protein
MLQRYDIRPLESHSIHSNILIEKFAFKDHMLVPLLSGDLIDDFVPVNFVHFFHLFHLSELYLKFLKLLSCF